MYVQIFQYFQNFASICAQNSVKILANPYTWRLCYWSHTLFNELTSRNSFKAFWHLPSWSSRVNRLCRRPALLRRERTRLSLWMSNMIARKSLSTRLNLACSRGNAPRPKMGSRYTHRRWIWFKLWRYSSRSARRVSQRDALSANPSK